MYKAEISRPAAYVGFTAFASLLIATFFGVQYTPYLAAATLLLGVVLWICRVRRKAPAALLILLTAAFFLTYYTFAYHRTVTPFERFADEKYNVEAVILSKPEKSSGNFYYKAKITHMEGVPLDTDFTIRLSHGESLNAEIDDTVSCTVKFFAYKDAVGLSSKTSWLSEDAALGGYVADYENITVTPAEKRSLLYHLAEIRGAMHDRIERAFPRRESSVLAAMLLGLRDEISDETEAAYKGAGATHILVISGMHMAIVSQFVLRLLQRIGIRKRLAAALTVLPVLLFMGVSGFSPSVLRSGITQMLFLLGFTLGRKSDALNALGVSAILILLIKPFWIGSVSFLLSFTSTVGIITLSPRLLNACTHRIANAKTMHIAKQMLTPAVCAVAAILGSLPVQLYVFGTVNLASVLTSVLVLGASAWIIRLGLPTVLLLCVPALSAAATPLIFVTGLLIRYQNFVTALISNRLSGVLYVSGDYVQGSVLTVAGFLLLAFWVHRGKPLPVSVFLLAAVLFLSGAGVNRLLWKNQTRLLVFHNTYAECTALIQNESAVILGCSGNSGTVVNTLRKNGVREIDLLIVGEPESDIRCAELLCAEFPAKQILVPETVYFPTESPMGTYRYGTTCAVNDDVTLNISSAGQTMAFSVYGNDVILDGKRAVFVHTDCDIAVVDSLSSRAHGALTLLCNVDTVDTAAQSMTQGQYILLQEHEAVCLNFKPDGSYTIKHG